MENRYIDLIHELRACETARNFVLARAEAAEAVGREGRAERGRYGDIRTQRLDGVQTDSVRLGEQRGEWQPVRESYADLSVGECFLAKRADADGALA